MGVMTIEEVVQMLEDCKALANSNEEVEKLKKEFIKNFKKEYPNNSITFKQKVKKGYNKGYIKEKLSKIIIRLQFL